MTPTPDRRPSGALLALVAVLMSIAAPGASHADASSRRTPVVTAVEATQDSVVSISTDELVRVRVGTDWYESWYGVYGEPRYREGYRQNSLGSGVVIHPDGYVVTNYHVVRRGTRIRVHFRDGRQLVARLVGTDPDSDLALLQVESDRALPHLSFARTEEVMLGETVIAIGNPFGLSHTVSTGIISALDRNLDAGDRTYFGFVQTDASINPGNSGGPLINLDGEVVGINTAIYGKGQNIGFAIPASRVRRIVDDLIARGEVREPWLGLDIAPVENSEGVAVRGLLSGSPARGKVQPGDLLVGLGGGRVGSPAEYRYRLRGVAPGKPTRIDLLRDGTPRSVTVTTTEVPPRAPDELLRRRIGIEVGVLDAKTARRFGLGRARGLVVLRVVPESPAARVGLAPGDRIRAVNAGEVGTLDELRRLVLRAERTGDLILVIQRGRRLYEVAFEL